MLVHLNSRTMKTLIFEKPSLSPLPNRLGWAFFTAFFWIVWVYLWMPLITLGIWALGFEAIGSYFQPNSKSELGKMKHLAIQYLSVIAVLGGSLLVWARIEFMRFRNVNRRTRPVPTQVEELASFAQVATETMADLSSVRRMLVHHDEHGKFLYAKVCNDEILGQEKSGQSK